jgi:hypothetical protein
MAESRTQPEVERFERLCLAFAQINHAVALSRSRVELLDEVAPGARFGDAGHHLDRVKMFADQSRERPGPTGTAFRTSRESGFFGPKEGRWQI